jgi:anhydro-N-acetylmuramic acid kinase
VPYLDSVLFSEKHKNIALQNLGGIGNIAFLPGSPEKDIIAFDTGPANAILNEGVELLTEGKKSFDRDGTFSRQGITHQQLLDDLLKHDYFKKPLPKSTGREEFGKDFVDNVVSQHPEIAIPDLLRTFITLITKSIKIACDNYLEPLDKLYLSGGGAHHPIIVEEMRELFGEEKICLLENIKGISVDSKEAIAFALLAHERLNDAPANIPSVTGAKYRTTLGKLTIPYAKD